MSVVDAMAKEGEQQGAGDGSPTAIPVAEVALESQVAKMGEDLKELQVTILDLKEKTRPKRSEGQCLCLPIMCALFFFLSCEEDGIRGVDKRHVSVAGS